MKHRICILLGLIVLSGCVDTPDTISRECRNANNENIDAVMMVTNETMAKRMTIRVFVPMKARYDAIDDKWDKTEKGWGRKISAERMAEVVESDNLHLYRAELKPNAQRLSLELARLRKLLNDLMDRARESKREAGENPMDAKAEDLFPALNDLVNKDAILGVLRRQLEKPKLEELLSQHFKGNLKKEMADIFKAKQKQFAPREEFQLVF